MMKRIHKKLLVALVVSVLLAVVVHYRLATRPRHAEHDPDLVSTRYPDYDGVVVPRNIAPLNFQIFDDYPSRAHLVVVSGAKGRPIVRRGKKIQLPERAWRRLVDANVGGALIFTLYLRRDGKWVQGAAACVTISPDPIDEWAHYRLIEPSYEYGNVISLNSRQLSSFREYSFVSNESFGQKPCLNCHSFQDRDAERFLFHFRDVDNPLNSGTILYNEGAVAKLPLKTPDGLPCVYPAWRPTGPFVVFSVNQTRQMFHTLDPAKVEVFDLESHLALYNVETGKLVQFTFDPDTFDTFPSWSPDGAWLYYSSATLALEGGTPQEREKDALGRVDEFRYNLMRAPFDEKTGSFGAPELVVDAASYNRSAVHPRVSPDGRFLVYTECASGAFPIWHNESDLVQLELATGRSEKLAALNSEYAETYHSWDSSGRWLIFTSRRPDGVYTRLWLAHFDENGVAYNPFPLPQRDPTRDMTLLKSYNVPELTRTPIRADGRTLVKRAKGR